MKKLFSDYLGIIHSWGILLVVLLLWLSCTLYYAWTQSTLPGSFVFGAVWGGILLPLNLFIAIGLGALLARVVRNVNIHRFGRALLATIPVLALSAGWVVSGYRATQPEAVFVRLFQAPLPKGTLGLGVNGTTGIDGEIWVISAQVERKVLEHFIGSNGYVEFKEAKGEEYYQKRFKTRAAASWSLLSPIKVFRKRTAGVERLIFYGQDERAAHFVYSTLGHDF